MLSDNIRNYRKENNLSQDELAEKLDVSRQSISLWENGQTQPTIDNIIALAKIFNISSDELFGYDNNAKNSIGTNTKKKKSKVGVIIAVILSVVLIAGAILLYMFFGEKKDNGDNSKKVSQNDVSSQVVGVSDNTTENTTVTQPSKSTNVGGNNTNKSSTSNKTTTNNTAGTQTPDKTEKFDLFTYCKNFAIQKGKLNGDYTIYQQPSNLYGGYDNEYFSMSYWGDSNMVEFCLHCPLDDTYSINFYLRMRGGYNGKYEYLSSRYYRDSGESVRSASGYIDPSVFSDKYPLNCDSYQGTTDKQNSFMEESRVGICDLIHCLKKFVEVENMECDFSAFGFVNF